MKSLIVMTATILLTQQWYATPLAAQELYLLAGDSQANGQRTYTWQLDYRQALYEYGGFSIGL